MRLNINTCTEEELYEECDRVAGSNFGHNMISIICNVAKKRFGKEVAEEIFETYQV